MNFFKEFWNDISGKNRRELEDLEERSYALSVQTDFMLKRIAERRHLAEIKQKKKYKFFGKRRNRIQGSELIIRHPEWAFPTGPLN